LPQSSYLLFFRRRLLRRLRGQWRQDNRFLMRLVWRVSDSLVHCQPVVVSSVFVICHGIIPPFCELVYTRSALPGKALFSCGEQNNCQLFAAYGHEL